MLVAALLMFVVLPRWAMRGVTPSGNLMASSLSVGLSFWIVMVTLLGYLDSVRYSVLFVVALFGLVAGLRLMPARPDGETKASSGRMRLWDVMEHPFVAIWATLTNLWHQTLRVVQHFFGSYGWIGSALVLSAMLWALSAGALPWLRQVGPGTPDGYTNLLRIASLASNAGLYSAGAAPTGVGALGAALVTAFFLPPLNALRFMYPLADLFTVLAAGMLAYQVTRSRRIAALVMFVVSVSSIIHLGLPITMESPLAMHWADVLVLLACSESMAWKDSHARVHRVLTGLALLGASLTSPPQALVGVFVIGFVCLDGGWSAIIWAFLGWVLGCVPLAVGMLQGQPLRPDGWLLAGFPVIHPIWAHPWSSLDWLIGAGIVVALINSVRAVPPLSRHLAWAIGGLALLSVFFDQDSFIASMLVWSGLLSLLVLIAVADTVLVPLFDQFRSRLERELFLVAAAVAATLLPAQAPTLYAYDVPLASATTLRIEQSFPPYEWTIVSPVNQYSEVLTRGWQEELSTFVRTYTLKQAKNPRYRMRTDLRHPILTPDVFLFVEPRLYPSDRPITRRDLTLPIAHGTATYRGPSLAAVESRAYYWAMAYLKAHPRSSAIYVHSPNLMVLWIRQ